MVEITIKINLGRLDPKRQYENIEIRSGEINSAQDYKNALDNMELAWDLIDKEERLLYDAYGIKSKTILDRVKEYRKMMNGIKAAEEIERD